MIVYGVYRGEDYEGGHVLSLHKTLRGAFTVIREEMANECRYSWCYGSRVSYRSEIRHSRRNGIEPRRNWNPWTYAGNRYWQSGCDNLSIITYEVQE